MTTSLKAFAKIPINANNYEASYAFLQRDKGIFTEGAVDAMLLEAFNAETNGKKTYAKQCVHQGLMIQYCEKLGQNGIGMFFKKCVFPTCTETISLLVALLTCSLRLVYYYDG